MTVKEKYNWNDKYTPCTVEEIREIAAKHNLDISIFIGYNSEENIFTNITVGSNRENADYAVELREKIMKYINPDGKELEILEDRRNEHTD